MAQPRPVSVYVSEENEVGKVESREDKIQIYSVKRRKAA